MADGSGSAVVRREIASDNSCLFNAVGYVMERTRGAAPRLRWRAPTHTFRRILSAVLSSV